MIPYKIIWIFQTDKRNIKKELKQEDYENNNIKVEQTTEMDIKKELDQQDFENNNIKVEQTAEMDIKKEWTKKKIRIEIFIGTVCIT